MKRITTLFLSFAFAALAVGEDLRIGIIGLDTSHVVAFTKILNDPKATGPLAEPARAIAAGGLSRPGVGTAFAVGVAVSGRRLQAVAQA